MHVVYKTIVMTGKEGGEAAGPQEPKLQRAAETRFRRLSMMEDCHPSVDFAADLHQQQQHHTKTKDSHYACLKHSLR